MEPRCQAVVGVVTAFEPLPELQAASTAVVASSAASAARDGGTSWAAMERHEAPTAGFGLVRRGSRRDGGQVGRRRGWAPEVSLGVDKDAVCAPEVVHESLAGPPQAHRGVCSACVRVLCALTHRRVEPRYGGESRRRAGLWRACPSALPPQIRHTQTAQQPCLGKSHATPYRPGPEPCPQLPSVVAGALALACTACTSGKGSTRCRHERGLGAGRPPSPRRALPPVQQRARRQTGSAPASTPASADPPPNPASVHANELGLVPVLMYHKLNAHPTSDYDRRPSDFVADLTYLEKNGLYPVTAANFVAGKIDIPAGKHAVVLTFDDGTLTQFLARSGRQAQAGHRPGAAAELRRQATPTSRRWRRSTSMPRPSAARPARRSSKYLTDHGDEVGDHTVHHYDLRDQVRGRSAGRDRPEPRDDHDG